MRIPAGEKRQIITIKMPYKIQDSYGNDAQTYVAVASAIRAKVEFLSGKKLFQAEQAHSEAEAEVTIGFRRNITKECIVVYGRRTLQILIPPKDPGEMHEDLVLTCKEIT